MKEYFGCVQNTDIAPSGSFFERNKQHSSDLDINFGQRRCDTEIILVESDTTSQVYRH